MLNFLKKYRQNNQKIFKKNEKMNSFGLMHSLRKRGIENFNIFLGF